MKRLAIICGDGNEYRLLVSALRGYPCTVQPNRDEDIVVTTYLRPDGSLSNGTAFYASDSPPIACPIITFKEMFP